MLIIKIAKYIISNIVLIIRTLFCKLSNFIIFDNIIIDKSELSDEEKELVDILINETDIYINIIDAENDSEEKDERQP